MLVYSHFSDDIHHIKLETHKHSILFEVCHEGENLFAATKISNIDLCSGQNSCTIKQKQFNFTDAKVWQSAFKNKS